MNACRPLQPGVRTLPTGPPLWRPTGFSSRDRSPIQPGNDGQQTKGAVVVGPQCQVNGLAMPPQLGICPPQQSPSSASSQVAGLVASPSHSLSAQDFANSLGASQAHSLTPSQSGNLTSAQGRYSVSQHHAGLSHAPLPEVPPLQQQQQHLNTQPQSQQPQHLQQPPFQESKDHSQHLPEQMPPLFSPRYTSMCAPLHEQFQRRSLGNLKQMRQQRSCPGLQLGRLPVRTDSALTLAHAVSPRALSPTSPRAPEMILSGSSRVGPILNHGISTEQLLLPRPRSPSPDWPQSCAQQQLLQTQRPVPNIQSPQRSAVLSPRAPVSAHACGTTRPIAPARRPVANNQQSAQGQPSGPSAGREIGRLPLRKIQGGPMQTWSSPRLCDDNKSGTLCNLEGARSTGSLTIVNVVSAAVQGPQIVTVVSPQSDPSLASVRSAIVQGPQAIAAASPQPEPQPEPQLPVASARLSEPSQLTARGPHVHLPLPYATSFSTSYAGAPHIVSPGASCSADVSRMASDVSNHQYGYSDAGSAGSAGVSRMASDAGMTLVTETPQGHTTGENTKRVWIAGFPNSQSREVQRPDCSKSAQDDAQELNQISPVAHQLAERIKLLQMNLGANGVDAEGSELHLRSEHEANQRLLEEAESEYATVKRLKKENELNQQLLEESENERASLQVLLGALAAQFRNSPAGKTSGAPALNLKHAKHFAAVEEERSRSSNRTGGSSSVVSSTTTLAPTADVHDARSTTTLAPTADPHESEGAPKTKKKKKHSEFVVHGLAGIWMCRSLGRLGLKTLRASWQQLASRPRDISQPCTLQPGPAVASEVRK